MNNALLFYDTIQSSQLSVSVADSRLHNVGYTYTATRPRTRLEVITTPEYTKC